jgi:exopolyphosphatase/guanosine-5'-triphosphate,3'-diphosphate pyrophosphatase
MKRLAVIDVGSNSIKAVVVDALTVQDIARKTESVRIYPVGPKMELTPDRVEMAANAIARLVDFAKENGAEDIAIVGTSALRECSNRMDLIQRVKVLTHLPLTVISGEVEARLTAEGVRSDPAFSSYSKMIVFDLGGGSLEAMILNRDTCLRAKSFPLGSVRLTQAFLQGELGKIDAQKELDLSTEVVRNVHDFLQVSHPEEYLVVGAGGGFVALGLYLEAIGEKPVNGRLPILRIRELKDRLCSLSANERSSIPGIPADRLDIMPAALITICALADLTKAEAFYFTSRGLRHGVIHFLLQEPHFFSYE